MIKKRFLNFLILEVLIAFLLISMTILPFSSYPYKIFKKELSYLESIAIEPYFTPSFFEALNDLTIEEKALPSIQIPFGPNETLTLLRSAKISKKSNPLKSKAAIITIDITLQTKLCLKKRQMKFFLKNGEVI